MNWELEKRVVVSHLQSSLTRIVVPQYQARNSNERAAWSIANTVSDNVKSQGLRYDSGCRAMGMPVLVVGGVVTKKDDSRELLGIKRTNRAVEYI